MLIYFATIVDNQIRLYFVNNTGKTIESISWVATVKVNEVYRELDLNCSDCYGNSNRIYRYRFTTPYAYFDSIGVGIKSATVIFQDGTVQENVEGQA